MKAVRILLAAAVALSPSAAARGDEKINVNTASEEQLMKLPDMTEARAKAIIIYRKNTGELIQLEELQLIPQVKPIYGKIKDKLVLE